MSEGAIYRQFIGKWTMIIDGAQYEQGSPPKSATYQIEEKGSELVFHMNWVDVEGEIHNMSFSGTPDGKPMPFAGGDLADSLAVEAVSDRELNSIAYLKGVELMVATRKLSEDYSTMDVTQSVNLPDGSKPANTSTYKREV